MSIELTPETQVDRFIVVDYCGEGGGGVVVRAYDPELNRQVALKFLHSSSAALGTDAYQRFLREGKILSTLAHQRLAKVYGLGVWQNNPYLAMEFVSGSSLREILTDGAGLPPARAIAIIQQVCDGMREAHKHGIVHRDLKPENIMLASQNPDAVKIIDFGLSTLIAATDQKLTSTGALVGTVKYMSPEQCLGLRADQRSDIYAIGCILFELLTGSAPFEADNAVAFLHMHANTAPPLASKKARNPALVVVDQLLLKALAKAPAERYQTLDELLADLESVSIEPHSRAKLGHTSLIVALFVALTFAYYWYCGAPYSANVLAPLLRQEWLPDSQKKCLICGNWYLSKQKWRDADTIYQIASDHIHKESTMLEPWLAAKRAYLLEKQGLRTEALEQAFNALDLLNVLLTRHAPATTKQSITEQLTLIHETVNQAMAVLEAADLDESRIRKLDFAPPFSKLGFRVASRAEGWNGSLPELVRADGKRILLYRAKLGESNSRLKTKVWREDCLELIHRYGAGQSAQDQQAALYWRNKLLQWFQSGHRDDQFTGNGLQETSLTLAWQAAGLGQWSTAENYALDASNFAPGMINQALRHAQAHILLAICAARKNEAASTVNMLEIAAAELPSVPENQWFEGEKVRMRQAIDQSLPVLRAANHPSKCARVQIILSGCVLTNQRSLTTLASAEQCTTDPELLKLISRLKLRHKEPNLIETKREP